MVEVSSELDSILQVIELNAFIDCEINLQGIAYDKSNDSIWITTGNSIIDLSKEGEILKTFELGKYGKYKSNGICLDEDNGTIWVLCYSRYLLKLDRNGRILEAICANYDNQDHICIVNDNFMITVGADYHGNNNFLITIDKNDYKKQQVYKLLDSYAVEGVCVLNEKIYIVNDGAYHNAANNSSYFCIYDFNRKIYDK